MAARVSGRSTDFKVKELRGKVIVYTPGFQKLKNSAFSPRLQASAKEHTTSNRTLDGEHSTRRETAAGEHLELVPGPFPHSGGDGMGTALPERHPGRRSPGLPLSLSRLGGRSGTDFLKKTTINSWDQKA